jgi:hypothetical protein
MGIDAGLSGAVVTLKIYDSLLKPAGQRKTELSFDVAGHERLDGRRQHWQGVGAPFSSVASASLSGVTPRLIAEAAG